MMLCTLEQLKTYLEIPAEEERFDDSLTLIIKKTSAQIENYLGYPLSRQENTEEVHSVNNEQLILLDNQPIQSVSSVTVGGLNVDDYKIIPKYAKVGMLYRGSEYAGTTDITEVKDRLREISDDDFRDEFVYLIRKLVF